MAEPPLTDDQLVEAKHGLGEPDPRLLAETALHWRDEARVLKLMLEARQQQPLFQPPEPNERKPKSRRCRGCGAELAPHQYARPGLPDLCDICMRSTAGWFTPGAYQPDM